MTMTFRRFITAAIVLLCASAVLGGTSGFPTPKERDKCPVCGMFVAKYPDWVAVVVLKDSTQRFFDGPKDMFKFLLDLKQYAPGKGESDIDRFFVTDYYAVKQIDGRAAFYVLGGDVYGPMRKELIPFEREAEAREFMKDHGGKTVLRFKEITSRVLHELD